MRRMLAAIASMMIASTGAAYAADLYIPAKTAPMIPAPMASSWEGFYAGVNVGYGPGTWSPDDTKYSIDFSGFFAGGQAGYNVSLGELILGAEADAEVTNETGSFVDGSYSDHFKLDWTGALTGHVGMPMGSFMPYLLAGVAFAHGSENDAETDGDPNYTGSSAATHVGFTVGVGGAAQLADNITGFIEARYADYGSATYDYSATDDFTSTFKAHLTDTTVRAGLNVHF